MDLETLTNQIIDSQPRPQMYSVRVLYEKNFNVIEGNYSYRLTVAKYSRAGVRLGMWSSEDTPSMSSAITFTLQHFTNPVWVRKFWSDLKPK